MRSNQRGAFLILIPQISNFLGNPDDATSSNSGLHQNCPGRIIRLNFDPVKIDRTGRMGISLTG